MASEFTLEAAVDLSGSRESTADYLTWLVEHTMQVGIATGVGAALIAAILGIGFGVKKAAQGIAGRGRAAAAA